MMTELLVGLFAGLGAAGRYALTEVVKRHTAPTWPHATLVINVCGSFFLGVLLGAGVPRPLSSVVGTGFLGGFTTFSTLQSEIIGMSFSGVPKRAAIYAVATYGCGVVAAAAGMLIGIFIVQ